VHAEGWYRDPYGIHSDRWFSDGQPTSLVRDQGVESRDEPPPREPPLPLVPVAEIEVSDGSDLLRADEHKKEWPNPVDASAGLGIGFY
jgi:hypothetical protein